MFFHQQASCKNHRVNRVVFLGNMKRLLTTGVSRWNTRQIALWDQVRKSTDTACICGLNLAKQVGVSLSACALVHPGGFSHANCGGGHRRAIRTVISFLWCWHTHAVSGRQGQTSSNLHIHCVCLKFTRVHFCSRYPRLQWNICTAKC